jgi:hypothetical protein
VTFDLHEVQKPLGDLYSSIYADIKRDFGGDDYCKDFGQFCVVRSDDAVGRVKNRVRRHIIKKGNRFASMDLVVFSVGHEISISRGKLGHQDLRKFRKFFVSSEDDNED